MKREAHALKSLRDFFRVVGIPPVLKRDNARTQVGDKWTDFERHMCVNGSHAEPHSHGKIWLNTPSTTLARWCRDE